MGLGTGITTYRDKRTPWLRAHLNPAVVSLYAGFLFTGAMTVLLGVMLPRVAALHHLRDNQAGALLMTQFTASACGALLVRRHFRRTVTRGYWLMAAGALTLIAAPPVLAIAAIGIFSLGLGMAMTSTSMLMGRLFPQSRGATMSFLNFCWSAGATVCPLVIARLPGHFSLLVVCVPIAMASAAFGTLVWVGQLPEMRTEAPVSMPQRESHLPIILLFSAISFLYVGTESTIGGWMSTYASRAIAWDFARSNLAAACFWAALLAGRGMVPLILQFMSELRLFLFSIASVSIGILILVEAHSSVGLLTGACWTGLALAPVFPLTIALFLERAPENRNSGWVFAIAGFGGAVLPWLTGVVSTETHSLRSGLLLSFAAAVVMLLLALRVWFPPRGTALKVAAADA